MSLKLRFDRQKKVAQLKMPSGLVVETTVFANIYTPDGVKIKLVCRSEDAQANDVGTQGHEWVEIPQEVIDKW